MQEQSVLRVLRRYEERQYCIVTAGLVAVDGGIKKRAH